MGSRAMWHPNMHPEMPRDALAEEPDGRRPVLVLEVDRHLLHGQAARASDREDLQVETEPGQRQAIEDLPGRPARESLQARLCVADVGQPQAADHEVEDPAGPVAAVDVGEELGAHREPALGQHAAGDREVDAAVECLEVKGSRDGEIVFYVSENEWSRAHELGQRYVIHFWGEIDLRRDPTEEFKILRAAGYPKIIPDFAAEMRRNPAAWIATPVKWRIRPVLDPTSPRSPEAPPALPGRRVKIREDNAARAPLAAASCCSWCQRRRLHR